MSIKFESPEIVPALLFQFEGEYELLRNGFIKKFSLIVKVESRILWKIILYQIKTFDIKFETVEVSQMHLSGCMQVGQMTNIPLSTSSRDRK